MYIWITGEFFFMSTVQLKNKITKELEELNAEQLKSAWLILKALSGQTKIDIHSKDIPVLEKKLAKGIAELDNKEGKDFGVFLGKMQQRYGSKK
jgi:hypothetical protein